MRSGWLLLIALLAASGCAHPTQGFEDDLGTGGGKGDGGKKGDGGGGGDMNPGMCGGKNLQTDPLNCGFCGNVCMLKDVAKQTCVNGGCTVGMCSPGFFDVNGMAADGCECKKDAQSTTATEMCPGATPAGMVTDSPASQITLTGNIVPANESDWYQIVSVDVADADGTCDPYDLKIGFTMDGNPNKQFLFDVLYDDCSTAASCGGQGELNTGLTSYDWSATGAVNGGECPCYNGDPPPNAHKCTDNSQTLRIRVYRAMNAPVSCDDYKISVTNGM
jgi:hypothetical protein